MFTMQRKIIFVQHNMSIDIVTEMYLDNRELRIDSSSWNESILLHDLVATLIECDKIPFRVITVHGKTLILSPWSKSSYNKSKSMINSKSTGANHVTVWCGDHSVARSTWTRVMEFNSHLQYRPENFVSPRQGENASQ